jgi:hypothetical protein
LLSPRRPAALLHRPIRSGHLLRRKPQAALPLHARGPYELHDLILGLLVHMVVIGLPISYSIRRFAK